MLKELLAKHPILQAPMAGVQGLEMALAAARGGAVAALPCAMVTEANIREDVEAFRRESLGPLNLNFFCHVEHEPPDFAPWLSALEPYFREYSLEPKTDLSSLRRAFDESALKMVRELKPEIVSFHFGLPEEELWRELKRLSLCTIVSATTLDEVETLMSFGVDGIILQGLEAGGHRGQFWKETLEGQMWLDDFWDALPERRRGVWIAAGGIYSQKQLSGWRAKGVHGVQVGTALLKTREINVSKTHREALSLGGKTELTKMFTGRYARAIENRLMQEMKGRDQIVPNYPYASAALKVLREKAEADGRADFTPLWAGTMIEHSQSGSAEDLLRQLKQWWEGAPFPA